MGRRAKNSVIDGLCRDWGIVRRQLLGVDDPIRSREYIGALRCTLGQRRDLHAGARSPGRVEQHFPEVYEGDALLVNEAYHRMRPWLKVVMDIHFCAKAPASDKAEFLGVSVQAYWREVADVRNFIDGYLAANTRAA